MGGFHFPVAMSHSVLLLYVSWLPTPVQRCLGGSVEPEDREISPARHGREPVGFIPSRSFGAEVKVRAAVGILSRVIARTERWERLAVGETRSVLSLIERHRPEIGGGNVGRQRQAIMAATLQ